MMNYNSFLKYLDKLQENVITPGLERITEACEKLGRPEKQFKSIHIAGTNGKGSTAAYLESIIRNSGHKVGLYTSPHLIDVRERVQINRELISEDKIVELAGEVREKCGGIGLSYFEFVTAIAYLYFSRANIDVAILETGLGGRWDATNVVDPILTILTPISIDHTVFLGDDLKTIAFEKCGIIKPNVTIVSANQGPEALEVIKKKSEKDKAPLIISKPNQPGQPRRLEMVKYQDVNAGLAAVAAKELVKSGFKVGDADIEDALRKTYWPGRLQKISENPEILVDGAHNASGCRYLAEHLKENYGERDVVIIFGAMKDKNLAEMTNELRDIASGWVLYQMGCKRSADQKELEGHLAGEKIKFASNPKDAVEKATDFGFKNRLIVVAGSLYLVGRFLKIFPSFVRRG